MQETWQCLKDGWGGDELIWLDNRLFFFCLRTPPENYHGAQRLTVCRCCFFSREPFSGSMLIGDPLLVGFPEAHMKDSQTFKMEDSDSIKYFTITVVNSALLCAVHHFHVISSCTWGGILIICVF